MSLWDNAAGTWIKPEEYSEANDLTDTQGSTVYYWTLVMGQIAAAISTTTKLQSVIGFFGKPYCFPNTTLNLMFVGEVLLGLVVIYWTPLQKAFETAFLPTGAVCKPIAALVSIVLIDEVRKAIQRCMEDNEEDDDSESEEESGSG